MSQNGPGRRRDRGGRRGDRGTNRGRQPERGRPQDERHAPPVHQQAPPAPAAHGLVPPADADLHELPHESLAPITLAFGIGLLGFGFLTSPVFGIVGLVTIAWALASWIGEIRHD
jgi:hypothetical protein